MIDLTPLDVRKKRGDFAKKVRGFDPEEVDAFLELVAERMEVLVKENLAFREEIEQLEERVVVQEGREQAVQEALVTAQSLRQDVEKQARREAELLEREAQTRIQGMIAESEKLLVVHTAALEDLERHRERFLKSFRALLERELDTVEVELGRAPLWKGSWSMAPDGGEADGAATHEDAAVTQENAAAAVEDMVATQEHAAAAVEDTVATQENAAAAVEDTVATQEHAAAAVEDTVAAQENAAASGEDTVAAPEDTVATHENAAATGEDTVAAVEDTVATQENAAASGEDTVVAVEDTVADQDEAAVEKDEAAADQQTSRAVGGEARADSDPASESQQRDDSLWLSSIIKDENTE